MRTLAKPLEKLTLNQNPKMQKQGGQQQSSSGSQSGSSGETSSPANPMTKEDAARIQSSQAKGGHDMGPGGFAARAQAAGDKNANAGKK